MNLRDILRIAFVGAVAYGFYKLGEKQGEKKSLKSPEPPPKPNNDYVDAEVVEEKSQLDCVRDLIESLKNKPNKNRKDKDTIELLQIKLQQMLKGKL